MAAHRALVGAEVKKRSGLGRGLDALLPSSGGGVPEGSRVLREVPLEAVTPNPEQPRRAFEKAPLEELAASIKNLGVLQPLLVEDLGDGSYRLIAGERRLRAARLAGLTHVPVVTAADDGQSSLERALVENLHREDLNPIEEAAGYKALIEDGGLTQEQLGERLGRNRTTISNSLRLLDLPEDIQRMMIDGKLSAGHGRALLGLNDHPMQTRLARRVAHEGMSVRACEEQVRKLQAMSGHLQKTGRPRFDMPPIASEAQRVLSERLQTKVRVDMGTRKGKIVVEFSDTEDLARLMTSIIGAPPDVQERGDSK